MKGNKKIKVTVEYGDLSYSVEGDLDTVFNSLIKWFNEVIPYYELARNLYVTIDHIKLADILTRYLRLSTDNKEIIFNEEQSQRLPLSNKILLTLGFIHLLHLLNKRDTGSATLKEISKIVVAPAKTVSSRLSELSLLGYVERDKDERGVTYRITVKGLLKLVKL